MCRYFNSVSKYVLKINKYCCNGNDLYESVSCTTWEYWSVLKDTIFYERVPSTFDNYFMTLVCRQPSSLCTILTNLGTLTNSRCQSLPLQTLRPVILKIFTVAAQVKDICFVQTFGWKTIIWKVPYSPLLYCICWVKLCFIVKENYV